jgi:PKD repeat protein
MKKLTILMICLVSFASVFAQVTRNKVVVEVGTGTWCPYCPGAAMGVDDLITNGWPVVAIENHNGDAFTNQYSNARNSYYGVPGYPTAYFDGGNAYIGGDHNISMYPNYWPRVQARMNIPSPVVLYVWGTHTGETYNVTVMVVKVGAINGSNIRLQLGLTESEIVYSWQGQSELNYVNRLMVPDQNGTELVFDDCDVQEIPLTFNVQSGWNLGHLELYAFVQTNSNKEIQNGYKVSLAWMQTFPLPLVASFTSDTTMICEANEIKFTNESTGYPTNWHWEFPGGIPDTSNEMNPIVIYNTPGTHDVSLVVTRCSGSASGTSLMEDYIDVFAIPEVTFAAIDDYCLNYPPMELTQGSPAGGIYSGPGVEDGFFHPDLAGIGTHTLVYNYVSEHGCENFAEQTVVVDACTGVPENKGVQVVTLPNPTHGSFKLSVMGLEDLVNLRIINSTGKTVYYKESIQLSGNSDLTIDLTGNSSGIYYINIEGNKSTYYKKIILQN